ncbi:MAG: signal peptidase II [Clostridia bacterium]|nr:signal peptidase II [Clostridia bacterium]
MKRRILECVIMLAVAGALIALDLVTKVLAASNLNMHSITLIPNLIDFIYTENTGAAFGMLSNNTWFLIGFTAVFIVAFVLFDIFNHSKNWFYRIGYVLVLAGAIGNLVDRIMFGFVRDFIAISFFPFIFNVADIFVTVGTVLLMIYVVFYMFNADTKEKK